jgi:hypothetical protein
MLKFSFHLRVFMASWGVNATMGTLTVSETVTNGPSEFTWTWKGAAGKHHSGKCEWEYIPAEGGYRLNLLEKDDLNLTRDFGFLTSDWDFPKFQSEPQRPWFVRGHTHGELTFDEDQPNAWTTQLAPLQWRTM